jgi:S-adenosylmethionine:tRNA ribosyltransferase-isomerase
MTDDVRLDAYDYPLPRDRIAQEPCATRSAARLLVYHRAKNHVEHLAVRDLPAVLGPGWTVVLNRSAVVHRKLFATRPTGGTVPLIVTGYADGRFRCLLSPFKPLKRGTVLRLPDGTAVTVVDRDSASGEFICDGPFTAASLEALFRTHGRAPLPPYIKRTKDDARHTIDRERYQTVFAAGGSSIAAPTAGLHLDEPLLSSLVANGVRIVYIRLDVGMGTFRQVSSPDITRHAMTPEHAVVGTQEAAALQQAHESGGRVLCVGTTTARTLEFLACRSGVVEPYEGSVDIYIYPPYRFRMVDALLTNFHLPRSTNLMMVAALVGRERVLQLYREALERGYRFFSYGDAMLVLP